METNEPQITHKQTQESQSGEKDQNIDIKKLQKYREEYLESIQN